jgi:HemY protein
MTVLFALLIIVAGFGLGAAWLGENPGMVTMTWFDYQVETSVSVLLLVLIIAAIILTFIYNFLLRLLRAPGRYAQRRDLKHYRLGLCEVTHSVAALAASDIASATRHTKKAEKALGTTPLTLLLRAQISKSAGSDKESRELLEQLLEYPETEYLAAKSLSDAAQKQHLLPQALTFAERANRINPKQSGGAWAVFDLHLNTGNFQEAEIHAAKSRKKGAFSRADMLAAKGRIALRQAENSYANGHRENALTLAQQAINYMKDDIRAAELCAKLYIEFNQPQRALKIIQQQWKTAPSDQLAAYFHTITENEKPEKKQKLVEKLIASNPAAAENISLG